MAAKIETIYTVTTGTNDTLKLWSAADANGTTVTIAAGSYFMGESHLDSGSYLEALYNALNTAGALCTTAIYFTAVTVSQTTHKVTITSSGTFRFRPVTDSLTNNEPMRMLGFTTASDQTAAASQTGDYQIGQSWWASDGSTSSSATDDAVTFQDWESNTAKNIYNESINGATQVIDIGNTTRRKLSFTFIPSDRCFGLPYGYGFPLVNGGFETGANGSATGWSFAESGATDFYQDQGNTSGRVTTGWPSFSSLTQDGSAFWELGQTNTLTGTFSAANYSNVFQYADLTGVQSVSFKFAYDVTGTNNWNLKLLLNGSAVYTLTPDANHLTFEKEKMVIDVSGLTGFYKLEFRNTVTTAGPAVMNLPHIAIDAVTLNSNSIQTRSVNEGLQSWWLAAKGGKRFRLYADASDRGQYRDLVLSPESAKMFAPERVAQTLDRWNLNFEVQEYVA